MKWNHNGIKYTRGCCLVLVAQFDGVGEWWEVGAQSTQQSARAMFKRLGEYFNAETVEVKRLYDDDGNPVEKPNRFCFSNGVLLVQREDERRFIPYWEKVTT